MTPRDVDQLSEDEYRAFVRYMNKEARELERANRKRR
jgi:hypothetical protein